MMQTRDGVVDDGSKISQTDNWLTIHIIQTWLAVCTDFRYRDYNKWF